MQHLQDGSQVLILKGLHNILSPLDATLTKNRGGGCRLWLTSRTPQTSQQVRASYNRLRPLEKLQVEKRGWTLDVLQVVQSLGKLEFTLADVYAHADALAKLHPNNAHVRDKMTIRRG